MKSKVYVIRGNPIPLARARLFKQKVYDPQRNKKLAAGIDIVSQHDDQPFITGPTHLDVTFYIRYPTSISRSRQAACQGKFHDTIPDLSNLIKFIEDICSGVIYKDDCIISSITAKKIYDIEPRTEFYFKGIE